MQDKLVFLYKNDFTEEDWRKLSWEFGFNEDKSSVDIHVIKDEDEFEDEDIVVCKHCGCEEYADEMREGMCPDCYEDYLEDLEEDKDE